MRARAEFSPAIAEGIMAQLAASAGVDPRSLDVSRLQWVVEARCRHLKLTDAKQYAEHLQSSAEEIDQLIDAIVVQETRFFRDPAVFEHLRLWLPKLAADYPGELRILSAPCSTGQEAYTIAATCVMAGIPLSRITVDAFDISGTGLEFACRGNYPEDALKKLSVEQQQTCGTLQHGHWKMHESLRRRIRFERRNLAEPQALSSQKEGETSEPYHLILCRNLFIYLKPEARTALARSLAASLAPEGRLILGSADRVEEVSQLFSPLKPAASFAFTHRQHVAAAPVLEKYTSPPQRSRHTVALMQVQRQALAVEVEPTPTTAEGLYRRAVEHQQHGELRRAERRCRQALYLDPKFLPAMELLEKLWSQHPNMRLRRALEARILRHSVGADEIGPTTGTWSETV